MVELTETERLFKSSLFRLEMDEMLKEVRTPDVSAARCAGSQPNGANAYTPAKYDGDRVVGEASHKAVRVKRLILNDCNRHRPGSLLARLA
jgi:hypothetical protein